MHGGVDCTCNRQLSGRERFSLMWIGGAMVLVLYTTVSGV